MRHPAVECIIARTVAVIVAVVAGEVREFSSPGLRPTSEAGPPRLPPPLPSAVKYVQHDPGALGPASRAGARGPAARGGRGPEGPGPAVRDLPPRNPTESPAYRNFTPACMEPFSSLLLSDRIWVPHAYRWDKLDCTCHLIAVRAGHLNALLEIVYAEAESGTERGSQAESSCTTPAATADTGSCVELSCGLSVVAEAGTDGNAMNKDVKRENCCCCCCVSTNEDDNSAPPINSTEKEDTTISTRTEREIFKHCCQIERNDQNIIKNPAVARDAESNTKQVFPGCMMQNKRNHTDVTYPIYKLKGNDQSQNTTNLQGGNIDTKEFCSSSSFQAAEKANVPNYPTFKTVTDVNFEQSWWKSDKALHRLWLVKLKATQRNTLEESDLEKMERARIAWEAAEVSMKGSECVPRVTGTGYNTVVPSIRWSDYVEKSEKLTKDVSLAKKQEKHEKEFKVGNLREETDQKDEETRLEEDESMMQQDSLDRLFQMMDCYSSLPIMQENTTSGETGGDTMRVGTSADGDKPKKVEAGCKGNEPYSNANRSVKVQAPVYGSPCANTSPRLYQWMPFNQSTCIQTVYLSQSLYGTLVYHPSMFTVPSYPMGNGKLAFTSFSQMQYVVPSQVPPTRSGCMQSVRNWQEQCAPYNNVVYQPTSCNQKQGNVVFSPYIRDAWIRGTRP